MNDSYGNISTFFIASFETQFFVPNYTYQVITLFNCQCNIFLVKYTYKNSCFLKRRGIVIYCDYYDIQFTERLFRTQFQERKTIHIFICLFFSLSYIFWYLWFSFSNLKGTSSFRFLWCIATSSLAIFSGMIWLTSSFSA